MTATTGFVILGMLSIEPMSGYKIRKEIEFSIGHFWSESDGQLYPALKRLAEDNLIEVIDEDARNTRGKKTYKITSSGQDALVDWLSIPASKNIVRNEFLLKLFFSANINHEQIMDALDIELAKIKIIIRGHKETERKIPEAYKNSPHYKYGIAALRFGHELHKIKEQWLEELMASFDKEHKQ